MFNPGNRFAGEFAGGEIVPEIAAPDTGIETPVYDQETGGQPPNQQAIMTEVEARTAPSSEVFDLSADEVVVEEAGEAYVSADVKPSMPEEDESEGAIEEAEGQAPAPQSDGGDDEPPTDGPLLPAGGEDNGDNEGEETDSETTEANEEGETPEVPAWLADPEAFDKRLDEIFYYKHALRDLNPTFRRVDNDIVIFHNQSTPGEEEDTSDMRPPPRVAFSMENPEEKVPVAELPDDSLWRGWNFERTSLERPLRTELLLKEVASIAPEPDAPIFREPDLAEAWLRDTGPEVMVAVPVGTSSPEPRTIEVLGRASFASFYGSREEKSVLDVRIEKTGERTTLLERADIGKYPVVWSVLSEAGLPVVPDLYVGPDNTLLATDLKADGSEFYGKSYSMSVEFRHEHERPRPEIDPIFMDLIERKAPEIEEQVQDYARKAAEAGVLLAYDDPVDMLVRPDGSFQVMALDLTRAEVDEVYSLEERMARNRSRVKNFSATLARTYFLMRHINI